MGDTSNKFQVPSVDYIPVFVAWYEANKHYESGDYETVLGRIVCQDIWEGYNDFILIPYRRRNYKKLRKTSPTRTQLRDEFLEFLQECELVETENWSLALHQGEFIDYRTAQAWYVWSQAHNQLFG